MDPRITVKGLQRPKFRPMVAASVLSSAVEISFNGLSRCTFDVQPEQQPAVSRLMADLASGGLTVDELSGRAPEIAEQVPRLLQDLDQLRLLVDSERFTAESIISGRQLYREVRRLADRLIRRLARSAFRDALLEGRATRTQLVGYALEYYWIVKMAPGLIAPSLGWARSSVERDLLQQFLRSELGHDRFLAKALGAVGVSPAEMEAHQPLPATFTMCASLAVYARQHPLSFAAVLFLFEAAQPEFIDAFDQRCRALGMPEEFYRPLRAHADLNADYEHEDISRDLMSLEAVVDAESATVVKRHVALMVETMIQQEEQILAFYGQPGHGAVRLYEGA